MKTQQIQDAKVPDPKELEKELSEFLSKKFGGEVKVVSPVEVAQAQRQEDGSSRKKPPKSLRFDLKPEELIAYLDQYVITQDDAKAVLSTKICTHFNRIKRELATGEEVPPMVGRIKNNVILLGPTGVGKTYLVKLIAQRIGVPFVKGDATKFSETGYVGGDVEDLVRDLVREADDDIEMAQYGIIYIDEIDKIAASHNLIGADVSRTGVQRALLKPMEETDVDLKVAHDPISMFQEIERFRKTGKREKQLINTRNILFIVSGAFSGLGEIIQKRLRSREIGFGARLKTDFKEADLLRQMRSEDLIRFGFESEFVGRLPVHAVLDRLSEDDLFEILKNPNNPVILGKKIDFLAYNIRIKFDNAALRLIARRAYSENTGARGLVSTIERALIPFERALPSAGVTLFPVTEEVIRFPDQALRRLLDPSAEGEVADLFQTLADVETESVRAYINENRQALSARHNLTLTQARAAVIAADYGREALDLIQVMKRIKALCEEIKKIELFFYKNHDINIVMEDDAIDYLIQEVRSGRLQLDALYPKLSHDFEHGLKLVRERTGKNRFFINRDALTSPETYIRSLLSAARKTEMEESRSI